MPTHPTPGAYQEALQVPEAAFSDPELSTAAPDLTPLGLPRVVTGAFAAVFPMTVRAGDAVRRYAVKCFLYDVPDQRARYRAIAAHLETARLHGTIPFDYQPRGITVDGRVLPILKMPWIDGLPLNRFVEAHLDAPHELEALAEQWRHLLAALEAAGTAHGDLQHGNILVSTAGEGDRIRLVDYDTMFVPALKGRASAEGGHRNYQHPDRSREDFGPYLDRFAGLVVYTALRACVLRPGLWSTYDTGENLLFQATDFFDPASSPLFSALEPLTEIGPLVEALHTACYLEVRDLPALEDILSGKARLDRPGRTARRPRRTDPTRRTPAETYFLPMTVLFLALTLPLWFASGPGTGFGATLAVGCAAAATAAVLYRRLPGRTRYQRLRRQYAYLDRLVDRLRREQDGLRAERVRVPEDLSGQRESRLASIRADALYDRLKYHFIQEAVADGGLSHKAVIRLKAAGIRTAVHATPDRVARATGISESSRRRVAAWRTGLVERYRPALPDALSPSEEHRLTRRVEKAIEQLDVEIARLGEKRRVQESERQHMADRMASVRVPSFGRYLAYLCRLGPLPSTGDRPQEPAARPVHPEAPHDDRPWWHQG